jgi:acetylornithine deacetylase/succinyl-diaminopimelate desuccinylase-like protein
MAAVLEFSNANKLVHQRLADEDKLALPLDFAGPEPRTAPYFTDASILTPAYGNPPTIILGPGEAAKAHQTDEHCSVERIRQATDIYAGLAAKWCAIEDSAAGR